MKTTKDLAFIHNSMTGSFSLLSPDTNPETIVYPKSILTVPAGTPTTHETAMGIDKNYNFVASYRWADPYYWHDINYHGINIPSEFVEQ